MSQPVASHVLEKTGPGLKEKESRKRKWDPLEAVPPSADAEGIPTPGTSWGSHPVLAVAAGEILSQKEKLWDLFLPATGACPTFNSLLSQAALELLCPSNILGTPLLDGRRPFSSRKMLPAPQTLSI